MSRSRLLLALPVVPVLLLACDRDAPRPGSKAEQQAVAVTFQSDTAAAPGPQAGFVGDASASLRTTVPAAMNRAVAPAPQQGVDVSSLPVDATAPMIVRTGTAAVKVDSLVPAIARLRVMARQLGGYTGATSIQVGSEQVKSASVELKVPAARWNELLEGMKPIGTLEHQEESAQDVGEEFVDVTARVANAKRLEARLLDLLATRTGKLADALEVEQSLAQVRQEIERYQGRLRYLSSRSAMSTMTVSLHEPAPLVGSTPGDNPIADAARTAWHLFIGLVALLISSLGIVIPLGLLVALLWWIRRNWGRRPAAA